MRDWRGGRGRGGRKPAITDGHHSRVTFHLKTSRTFDDKFLRDGRCTRWRRVSNLPTFFSPFALTDKAPQRKQKCNSTQNRTSHGFVCLLTNLRPSQYRAKPARGAFTLTHKKSKNAALHTCDLNLQLPHINRAAVVGQ